jgi:hypothetical protein
MNGETLFSRNRPNIFLTSFFRSGSTHIKETLLRLLPGYRSATTVLSAGEVGDDGYCPISVFAAQILFPQGSYIFHQHTPGTAGNVAMLRRYEIKPVVQMRNMLDSLVSARELLATGQPQHLGIYYPKDFSSWDKDDQFWWMIQVFPTWYFTFYDSWKRSDLDVHYVWYDEYYKDQVKGVRGIFDHVGLQGTIDDAAIEMASNVIDPGLSRFKFGRPGRGREEMTPQMTDAISQQALRWPDGESLLGDLIWRGYD